MVSILFLRIFWWRDSDNPQYNYKHVNMFRCKCGHIVLICIFEVLLNKKGLFCSIHISKIQVRIIYRAKFQVKICMGSLIILTAIVEMDLPPLLNSKMAEVQFWDLGREEVTSNNQHVPTFACKVTTGVRVHVHANEQSHCTNFDLKLGTVNNMNLYFRKTKRTRKSLFDRSTLMLQVDFSITLIMDY